MDSYIYIYPHTHTHTHTHTYTHTHTHTHIHTYTHTHTLTHTHTHTHTQTTNTQTTNRLIGADVYYSARVSLGAWAAHGQLRSGRPRLFHLLSFGRIRWARASLAKHIGVVCTSTNQYLFSMSYSGLVHLCIGIHATNPHINIIMWFSK